MESETNNEKKKANGSHEWGVKDSKGNSTSETQPTKVEGILVGQASSSNTTSSQDVVLGPNNTTIRILSGPPLVVDQKENFEPNSKSTTARQRSQKKTEESSLKQNQGKGINLKGIKKPLQINSDTKKALPKKPTNNNFPITLKAIEEFYSHTQLKAYEFQNILSGKPTNVDMMEMHDATTAKNQLENVDNQRDQTAVSEALI
ncbi:unnamed protein product [Linum trigynum]|uniref:Uncharacterized protein n=1 Tax=Linum trigynum TaxID=586398 RepID=A0AAV2DE83_9ROSI